jgi:26S proteasome regulatory subunit N2
MSLGLVLGNNPQDLPKLLNLISTSFNPHLRYGACMAIGICCASSGQKSAYEMLSSLVTDRVGFVKQAAYIALSMLLINTPHGYKTNDQGKYAKELKEKLEKMCQSRQEEALVRFGSMISLGLIEAGGRNQTIQLFSKYTTYKRNAAIAGMLLFTQ